jgi:predicted ATPase
MQWADIASFDMLHYGVRRWAEGNIPVLLLLSLRSEALEHAEAPQGGDKLAPYSLAEWLSYVNRDLPVTRLTLSPLTSEDTLRLIRGLTDKEATSGQAIERFGQWLFAETGGQPFFLMETLKALLERNLLALHFREDGRLGDSFRGCCIRREHITRFIADRGI